MGINKKYTLYFLIILIIQSIYTVKYNNINNQIRNSKDCPEYVNRLISEESLNIIIYDPINNSVITNGTTLIFKLTGSLDKNVTYQWSTETYNSSLIVLDQYFSIPAPDIVETETILYLNLYASINSSEVGSSWINKSFKFKYDTKIPSLKLSILNQSYVHSYTTISLNFSESIFNSYYLWDKNPPFIGIFENTTEHNITIEETEGEHILQIFFEDEIGNKNETLYSLNILYNIQTNPENNSRIQSDKLIIITASNQYPLLFAWDNEDFSGMLDTTPENEGAHTLHILAERSPNEYIRFNNTYIIDNTPIDVSINPNGGIVTPNFNVSIYLSEKPTTIICKVHDEILDLNSFNPYWVILPEEYGKINLTIITTDSAENVGIFTKEFDITLSIITMVPQNNTIINQGESIEFEINANEIRTILFNLNNAYNTSYFPSLPHYSGLHNLTIYIEDLDRKWNKFFYQWWIKPSMMLENSFNKSQMRTYQELNFTFGEFVSDLIYKWGNDSETQINNVNMFQTSMDDWSNKTALIANLSISIKGKENIWNNKSYSFTRDDIGINISLYYEFQNRSMINYPFVIKYNFSEVPYEVKYSWDNNINTTINPTENLVYIEIPLNITINPHNLSIYFRDVAYNWGYNIYQFYTGTGIYFQSHNNESLIRGGIEVKFELTLKPIKIDYIWTNPNNTQNITALTEVINSSTIFNITVPIVSGNYSLKIFLNIGENMILEESLLFQIDSAPPTVKLLGTENPFKHLIIVENNTIRTMSESTVINFNFSENLSLFECKWNNELIYNNSYRSNESFIFYLQDYVKINGGGNISIKMIDKVKNCGYYIFYIEIDYSAPQLMATNVPSNSKILPNTSIIFFFNDSIYYFELLTIHENIYTQNDSTYHNSSEIHYITMLEDGKYEIKLNVFDISGNNQTITFYYAVDTIPPIITSNIENKSRIQSFTILIFSMSEDILNNSYWCFVSEIKHYINKTKIEIQVLDTKDIEIIIKFYLSDILGNSCTKKFIYDIDNTPVDEPRLSIPDGSFYNDIETIFFYFNEKPAVVIFNWNDGENFTTPIIEFNKYMVYSLTEEYSEYYIQIDLPKEVMKSHHLVLYVKDNAGNWIIFQYNFFKTPNLTDFLPAIFIIISIVITIVINKRNSIKKKINKVIKNIKDQYQSSENSKQEIENKGKKVKPIDGVIYKKGEKREIKKGK